MMWELKEYNACCQNSGCDSFDTCIECWDEWAERNLPMTNADRIRAMSDEELAWELMVWRFDAYSKAKGDESTLPSSQKTILDWLKQPVKDGDTDG